MSDVIQLPKYPVPGYEELTPDEAAIKLHNKKNRAVRPEEDMEFPPYMFKPFPVAVYRDWNPLNFRRECLRVAANVGADIQNDRQMQIIEDGLPEWETALVGVNDYDAENRVIPALREKNERELARMLDGEWCPTPDDLRKKKDRLDKIVAQAAAERAFDDRRLGGKAKAELERIEDAADDHVVAVPEARKNGDRDLKGGR